jgi:hypothetical protein
LIPSESFNFSGQKTELVQNLGREFGSAHIEVLLCAPTRLDVPAGGFSYRPLRTPCQLTPQAAGPSQARRGDVALQEPQGVDLLLEIARRQTRRDRVRHFRRLLSGGLDKLLDSIHELVLTDDVSVYLKHW